MGVVSKTTRHTARFQGVGLWGCDTLIIKVYLYFSFTDLYLFRWISKGDPKLRVRTSRIVCSLSKKSAWEGIMFEPAEPFWTSWKLSSNHWMFTGLSSPSTGSINFTKDMELSSIVQNSNFLYCLYHSQMDETFYRKSKKAPNTHTPFTENVCCLWELTQALHSLHLPHCQFWNVPIVSPAAVCFTWYLPHSHINHINLVWLMLHCPCCQPLMVLRRK